MQDLKFTAIIQKGENGWYIGQVAEMPGALSQGRTIPELIDNLNDALQLLLESEYIKSGNTSKKATALKLNVPITDTTVIASIKSAKISSIKTV